MDLLDDAGRLRQTPAVTERILDLAEGDDALTGLVDVDPDRLPWGGTGMCFAGRWVETGEDAVLKVGVSPAQRFWSMTVGERDPELAPRVFASGDRLAGEDLGWVLMERLPSGLHAGWGGVEFGLLMDAGVRFQRLARTIPEIPVEDVTEDRVRGWIRSGQRRGAPGPADRVLQRLRQDWRYVTRVCGTEVCHGDLHMANALMRVAAPAVGSALLIDFEPVRMPWVFDAAYPQILNSDPARAGWQDMVGQMADRRRARGLPVCSPSDLARVGAIALGWYALRMWGLMGPIPDPDWRDAGVWADQTRGYIEGAADA